MIKQFIIEDAALAQKMDSISTHLTSEWIDELAKNIIASNFPLEKKRDLFASAFHLVEHEDILEGILNLWAIALMLKHAETPFPMKIDAVRQLLKDSTVTDDRLNDWVRYVWLDVTGIDDDMLSFLAVDVRNHAKNRLDPDLLEYLNSPKFY
ncbi:hypothetical protein [Candidatus Lokiarchaeum ossiferum]|uniref:hypothetical protein n=1 Tax=Candidatus Lokiarchaeum ossiferum TaxID=2951803 RepID=UPI00352EE21C